MELSNSTACWRTGLRERLTEGHTRATYAYAFQLLFAFASRRLRIAPSALQIEHLDAPLALAFLDHLRHERGNGARTRNGRLAAVRVFMRFLEHRVPAALASVDTSKPAIRGRVKTGHTKEAPGTGVDVVGLALAGKDTGELAAHENGAGGAIGVGDEPTYVRAHRHFSRLRPHPSPWGGGGAGPSGKPGAAVGRGAGEAPRLA